MGVPDAMRRAFCLWWFWWLLPVLAVGVAGGFTMISTGEWTPAGAAGLLWTCLGAGLLLTIPLPMALIGLSSDYEWSSLNVAKVFKSIGQTAGPYMVLWLYSAGVLVVYSTATVLVWWTRLPISLTSIPLVGLLVILLRVLLACGLVMTGALAFARAAGLFASAYRDKLDFSL
jgi:hypothetical protein